MPSFDSTNNQMDAPAKGGSDNSHAVSLSQEANSLHKPMSASASGPESGAGGGAGGGMDSGKHGASMDGGKGMGGSSQGMDAAPPPSAAHAGAGHDGGGKGAGASGHGTDAPPPPAAGGAGGGDGGGDDNSNGGKKGGHAAAASMDSSTASASAGADNGHSAHKAEASAMQEGASSNASYDHGGKGARESGASSQDHAQSQMDQINAGFDNTASLYGSNSGAGDKSGDAQKDGAGDKAVSDSTGDPHHDRAKEILSGASDAEKTTTPDMKDLADKHGGEMVGLDHRLKTEDSLARKLKDEGMTDVNDALRYTMSFDKSQLADGANNVMKDMEAQGYQKEQVKNTFPKDNAHYKGINTTFSKDGQQFEVQFHTPESLKAKDQTHGPYEANRELMQKDEKGVPSYKSPEELGKVADKYAHYLAPHPELAAQGKALSEAGRNNSPEATQIAHQLRQSIGRTCAEISKAIPKPDNIGSVEIYKRNAGN